MLDVHLSGPVVGKYEERVEYGLAIEALSRVAMNEPVR
jgi:hypothetical protein